MPVLDRQAAPAARPSGGDAPAQPPGPAAAVRPGGRADTPAAVLHQPERDRADLRRDRDHGPRARDAAVEPAGQALRPRGEPAARRDHRRRGRPDLAVGLGLDAGRPGEGARSAWPGWRSAWSASAPSSWPRSPSCWRELDDGAEDELMDDEFERGPDGRSTDVPSGRGVPGVARGQPELLLALRRARSRSARCPARIAIASPAPGAATSPTSTRASWSRRCRSPTPARSCSSGGGSSPASARGPSPAASSRSTRRSTRPRSAKPGRRPACSSSRARSSGSYTRLEAMVVTIVVRGADRRRDRGADPRGDRGHGLPRPRRSRGPRSRSRPRSGRCATGSTGAARTSGHRSRAGAEAGRPGPRTAPLG